MAHYKKIYAHTDEDAISYLKANYDFNGKFSSGYQPKGFAPKHTITKKSAECACGESTGFWVSDENANVIEVVVVCENCYDDAPDNEKV